jgi:pimeloyl-ACP methyl ester carboxylesterase
VSISATLAIIGGVALRHALETPQPLKSLLPGEALLYRWQRRSIFYKVLGSPEAPPLVLLHSPQIGASADEMWQIMSSLATTYRVYAPDLLGFGLSDRPAIEYSAALYTSLCQDFLRDVVTQPAIVLASELSCNYAVSLATSAPDLCTALVLISPRALSEDAPISVLRKFAESPLSKILFYPLLSTRFAFAVLSNRRKSEVADFTQFYAQTHQLGAENAAMALLAGKLAENLSRQFATLGLPILMIWGTQALEERHALATIRQAASRTREVELIQGAGLAVHIEQAESVVAAIQRWQAKTASATLPTRAETRAYIMQEVSRPRAQASEPDASLQQARTSASSMPLPSTPKLAAMSMNSPSSASAETPSARQDTGVAEEREVNSDTPAKLKIVAYCVKCKRKTTMLNAREVTMKNGRQAMRGSCEVCGTNLNRIGGVS